MKKLLVSCLVVAALSANAALGADLVDVTGFSQKFSGGNYHTYLTLKMKFSGPASFKPNNRAVASPEEANVTSGKSITIHVVSPQQKNLLTIRDKNRGQVEQVKW